MRTEGAPYSGRTCGRFALSKIGAQTGWSCSGAGTVSKLDVTATSDQQSAVDLRLGRFASFGQSGY